MSSRSLFNTYSSILKAAKLQSKHYSLNLNFKKYKLNDNVSEEIVIENINELVKHIKNIKNIKNN